MRLNSPLAHQRMKLRLLTGKTGSKTPVWAVSTAVFERLENGYV